ncbi:hypothetical protein ElyMa_005695500 [Elysia marginata]|uniref:Uncharacterized protein n=1 Tax=Elysia marginata TaxID=1093978 RepID=A0AAV4FFN1_9GAST|nr:hypothetical protein ElyMa_005695500 [Elysia marginata]
MHSLTDGERDTPSKKGKWKSRAKTPIHDNGLTLIARVFRPDLKMPLSCNLRILMKVVVVRGNLHEYGEECGNDDNDDLDNDDDLDDGNEDDDDDDDDADAAAS